jgi:transposase
MTKKLAPDLRKNNTKLTAEEVNVIVNLRERSMSWSFIAKTLRRSKATVQSSYNRYKVKQALPPREQVRHASITPYVGLLIRNHVDSNPNVPLRSIPGVLRTLVQNDEFIPSYSTIHRYLLKHNYISKIPRFVPLITQKHQQQRLTFAREMLAKCSFPIENILFTDETTVRQYGTRPTNTWFIRGSRNQPTAPVTHGGGVRKMFWGCISIFGYGLLIPIENTMDSNKYKALLREVIKPYIEQIRMETGRTLILMQDNAPCHRSKAVLKEIDDLGLQTFKWPACSPDLNPIENAWSLLKRRRQCQHGYARNVAELVQQCTEIWGNFPASEAFKLVQSFRRRLEDVIASSGCAIHY